MRKFFGVFVALTFMALSFVFIAPAANASTDRIGICHATGTDKYVLQEISKDGTANGHAGEKHQDGRDIIPAFSWVDNKVRYYFEGQNLDKIDILNNGCVSPVETVVASPIPPKYVPASCARPNLPYGEVVVPADKGTGVAGASDPRLNADNTVWSVSYAPTQPSETKTTVWPEGFDGSYHFNVVPLTADPNYVVDSKTGVGQCELPETGAKDYILPVGGALVLLTAGGVAMVISRRRLA
jgi:LPXTG-motif cell wall-anchored protein